MIKAEHLQKAISYQEYQDLVKKLLERDQSTGTTQSPEYTGYSKLNLARMQRLDKTITLSEKLKEKLARISHKYLLVILTEGWCGDAAQSAPVFAAIERFQPLLQIKILLRDTHPEVMDQYLTIDSRSIPKVVCLRENDLGEEFIWGPRPALLQHQVLQLLNQQVAKEEKVLFIQKWYNENKTAAIQEELTLLFDLLQ